MRDLSSVCRNSVQETEFLALGVYFQLPLEDLHRALPLEHFIWLQVQLSTCASSLTANAAWEVLCSSVPTVASDCIDAS